MAALWLLVVLDQLLANGDELVAKFPSSVRIFVLLEPADHDDAVCLRDGGVDGALLVVDQLPGHLRVDVALEGPVHEPVAFADGDADEDPEELGFL